MALLQSPRYLRQFSSSYQKFFLSTSKATIDQTYGGMPEEIFRQLCEDFSPFVKEVMGLKIRKLAHGKVTMVLPFNNKFVGNPIIPCLHGGVSAALIDHVGGFCAWSILTEFKKRVSTVDLRIDYLLPAPCEEIVCEAVVNHGTSVSRLIRVDIECWDKGKTRKLVIGRAMYNVYDAKI